GGELPIGDPAATVAVVGVRRIAARCHHQAAVERAHQFFERGAHWLSGGHGVVHRRGAGGTTHAGARVGRIHVGAVGRGGACRASGGARRARRGRRSHTGRRSSGHVARRDRGGGAVGGCHRAGAHTLGTRVRGAHGTGTVDRSCHRVRWRRRGLNGRVFG